MASSRAEAVAEVLWELKRLEKLACYSQLAQRAGFKAGPGAKNVLGCLDHIRRDWSHLQWWRAVADDGCLDGESEHARTLRENGYVLDAVPNRKGFVQIVDLELHAYVWAEESAESVA